MNHSVVRAGRNAAREAKRLKEIRKVKAAIQWHERERKKRQEINQERWESKATALQRVKLEAKYVKDVRQKALENAKEDWRLGPLRPNRAVGEDADKYGALTRDQLQETQVPVRVQKWRNEQREKKGLELKYPLVVDDKKYFHIVKDDRVVVLKGRAKDQIGVVADVMRDSHQVIIKGLNKHYYDSSVFNSIARDESGPMQESEVPIHIDDVRLIIAAELTQRQRDSDEEEKVYQDVIVEKIDMERHTTGIDPFTGTDYGDAEIPKDHQYDPRTGLPIFHRYIAGTRHRIEWPWEREEDFESSDVRKEGARDRPSLFQKTMSTLRHPIAGLQRWRNKGNTKSSENIKQPSTTLTAFEKIEQNHLEKLKTERPQSQKVRSPDAFDFIDTSRDIVEGTDSMSYTLLSPPFPKDLGDELRDNTRDFIIKAKKDSDAPSSSAKVKGATPYGKIARELARERKEAAEKMKTPMQLRWEAEHAKKVQQRKKNPLVATDALLGALGQHMQKNGVKVPQSKAASKLNEVD